MKYLLSYDVGITSIKAALLAVNSGRFVAIYEELKQLAAQPPVGAAGLRFLPFGNGTERALENCPSAASLYGLQFNVHSWPHMVRAAQEGTVYALNYGIDIVRQMGVRVQRVRASYANMFLSPVFREAFVNTGDLTLKLYVTYAAQRAARGAGIGAGIYTNPAEAFAGLQRLSTQEPDPHLRERHHAAYYDWLVLLKRGMQPEFTLV